MSTAIAKTNGTALAAAQAPTFTPEQERMIRDSFLSGASNEEAAMLMEVARLRRLNPLFRQIHFVKRWDSMKRCEVWSYQVSIDGLRAIAERTGKYDGQSDPEWEYGKDGKPSKCVVRVYRKDWSPDHHAAGVAFFEEYAQTKKDGGLTKFWADKPRLMLAKCAEALALRKAFPEDMGGLYTAEEMGADAEVDVTPKAPPAPAPAAKREPVVVPTPDAHDLAEDDETRRKARALVEAAAAELGGTVETPNKTQRARLIWQRAHNSHTHNMTAPMFSKFVAETLGAPKPSAEWSAEDMAKLEAALTKAEADVP